MNYLNYTFTILKECGLVSGWNDYSKRYLKKCESYARSYRARGKDLPLPTMIVLTASVDKTANNLLASNVGRVAGEELKQLAMDLSIAVYDKALSSS
ncbi:hypothetical protein MTBPR1_50095 [Candidatus Terasakiella magnetica]|uniref:Uncharacterized protein n=1 Tax=Candidatus Terasakiella magnetica TaxID=1867952 RepID=A0A1C3RJB4_9PROT|nr:DUF6626 family protein [Candidatus Terasakiella magnetica]SCA57339.1 hypothetical protein MTBPR1_50095 [Candidatus Terasakiella magnetica]